MKIKVGDILYCIKDLDDDVCQFQKGNNYKVIEIQEKDDIHISNKVCVISDTGYYQWFLINVNKGHLSIPQYFKTKKEIRSIKLKKLLYEV